MSDNNDIVILGVAVVAYMYLKNRGASQYVQQPVYGGGVASLPGSIGNGNNQVKTGALLGFLQAISGSLGQAQPVVPRNVPYNTGAVQDDVYDPWAASTMYDDILTMA